MKNLFCPAAAFTIFAALSAGASAGQPVSDTDVSQKLDQLNATAQIIDSRLQQIFTQLTLSTQTGACWLDGKAFSQGGEIMSGGSKYYCSVQSKTGWPQWENTEALSRPFRR